MLAYTLHDGEVLVLLGRERETLGWREGSHKWSSFSGKVEGNENSLEGAAREFMEESCACVPTAREGSFASMHEVEDMLRARARAIEQTMYYKGECLVYCTYIVRIPHFPYEERFAKTQEKLFELDLAFRNFYRIKKLGDAVPRFFLPGFVLSSRITVVDFRVVGGSEVEVVMHEEGTPAEVILVFSVAEDVIKTLSVIEDAWRALQSFIEAHLHDPIMAHPAVKIVTSRNQIVNAYVNRAYLEKCEIRWWRLNELLALKEQSCKSDNFRKLFLENLTTMASHIRLLEEQQANLRPQSNDTARAVCARWAFSRRGDAGQRSSGAEVR